MKETLVIEKALLQTTEELLNLEKKIEDLVSILTEVLTDKQMIEVQEMVLETELLEEERH